MQDDAVRECFLEGWVGVSLITTLNSISFIRIDRNMVFLGRNYTLTKDQKN